MEREVKLLRVAQHPDGEGVPLAEGNHRIDALGARPADVQRQSGPGDVGDREVEDARAGGDPGRPHLDRARELAYRRDQRLRTAQVLRVLEARGLLADPLDAGQGVAL